MLKPSQYRTNAETRIAEIEAESRWMSGSLEFAHQAGSFKALAGIYAGLADQENAERIAEQREGNTIRRALDILEVADANEITDAEFACFFDFLAAKMAEREKQVAWARKGLNMPRTVSELETLLNDACENDGLIIGDGDMLDEYAEERRCFDRAEARAMASGAS